MEQPKQQVQKFAPTGAEIVTAEEAEEQESKVARRQPDLVSIMENPSQLTSMMEINEQQAENIAALVTGVGAGMARKHLSTMFGTEIASAIGGFLGSLVAKKVIGK